MTKPSREPQKAEVCSRRSVRSAAIARFGVMVIVLVLMLGAAPTAFAAGVSQIVLSCTTPPPTSSSSNGCSSSELVSSPPIINGGTLYMHTLHSRRVLGVVPKSQWRDSIRTGLRWFYVHRGSKPGNRRRNIPSHLHRWK